MKASPEHVAAADELTALAKRLGCSPAWARRVALKVGQLQPYARFGRDGSAGLDVLVVNLDTQVGESPDQFLE